MHSNSILRGPWIYAAGLTLSCLTLAPTLPAQAKSTESSRPNIVIIYTDDQGYGDVSALNPECQVSNPAHRSFGARRHDFHR